MALDGTGLVGPYTWFKEGKLDKAISPSFMSGTASACLGHVKGSTIHGYLSRYSIRYLYSLYNGGDCVRSLLFASLDLT